MKPLKKPAFVLLLTLISAVSFSQNKNVSLFNDVPDQLQCEISQFENAFLQKQNSFISFKFGSAFTFSGKIVSITQRYHNLSSVVVESPRYNNALFHLSRQINKDKTISWVGRIMNSASNDGFEIKKDAKGNYSLVKINTARLLETCKL
ncbi:MAG: hypothetical protein EOO04_29085 [Chitinophagaceae bacterium]|nr:MAG: hypothetical protein EOO04_29085 [Chitinophagaceae bacterium]